MMRQNATADQRFRGRSRNPIPLAFLDFTTAPSADIGVTPGAKTLTLASGVTVAATLVNAGSAFLRADPNGIVFTNGTGLVLDTNGAVASTDDLNPDNLCATLEIAFSDAVPSALWASTEIALRSKYASIEVVAIIDASGCTQNTELLNIAIGNSNAWSNGASLRVGWVAGAAACGAASQTATFDGIGGVLSLWGLAAMPTAVRLVASPSGVRAYAAPTTGLAIPSTWYEQDAKSNQSVLNSPTSTSGTMTHTSLVGISMADISATGGIGVVKALYLRATKHPAGTTVVCA